MRSRGKDQGKLIDPITEIMAYQGGGISLSTRQAARSMGTYLSLYPLLHTQHVRLCICPGRSYSMCLLKHFRMLPQRQIGIVWVVRIVGGSPSEIILRLGLRMDRAYRAAATGKLGVVNCLEFAMSVSVNVSVFTHTNLRYRRHVPGD